MQVEVELLKGKRLEKGKVKVRERCNEIMWVLLF
jgi:hypothetical protein